MQSYQTIGGSLQLLEMHLKGATFFFFAWDHKEAVSILAGVKFVDVCGCLNFLSDVFNQHTILYLNWGLNKTRQRCSLPLPLVLSEKHSWSLGIVKKYRFILCVEKRELADHEEAINSYEECYVFTNHSASLTKSLKLCFSLLLLHFH